MLAGTGTGIATETFTIETARTSTHIKGGVASLLLFGRMMLAEIDAGSSRGGAGFRGSLGDSWRRAPSQPGNLRQQGAPSAIE
jgi:hypothetical protein